MLGATPVIFKGPRHMASWLFAFACIQLCPRDSVYNKLQDHPVVLLVVRLGCALYKLRKFNFVAAFALHRHQSLPWLLLTEIVVIDGNNFCSRISTWGWLRGFFRQTTSADLCTGGIALAQRIVPILFTSILYFRACGTLPHWGIVVPVKLIVFAVFLLRYDVHTLARKAWNAGLDGGSSVHQKDHSSDLASDTRRSLPRPSSWQHLAAAADLGGPHPKSD